MFRIFKILLVTTTFFLFVAIFALFFRDSLIAWNKESIERLLSSELSLQVTFDALDISLYPDPAFQFSNLNLESPDAPFEMSIGTLSVSSEYAALVSAKKNISINQLDTLFAQQSGSEFTLHHLSGPVAINFLESEEVSVTGDFKASGFNYLGSTSAPAPDQATADKANTDTTKNESLSAAAVTSDPPTAISFKKGTVQLKSLYDSRQRLTLAGYLAAAEVDYHTAGFHIAADDVSTTIRDAYRTGDGKGAASLEPIQVQNLSIESATDSDTNTGTESSTYTTALVEMPLKIEFDKEDNFSLNGKMDIQQFAYRSGELELSESLILLKDLKGSIQAGGSVDASTSIEGRSFQLSAPDFSISQLENLNLPLTFTMTADGQYKLAGPLTINDAALEVASRSIQQLALIADIEYSDSTLDVRSNRLEFSLDNMPLQGGVQYQLSDKQQVLSDSWISFPSEGKTILNATLSSTEPADFAGSMSISNVSFATLMQLSDPSQKHEVKGSVVELKSSFSASGADLANSLTANGSFVMNTGNEPAKNLSEKITSALRTIPPMDFLLSRIAPDSSSVGKATGKFSYESGILTLQDSEVDLPIGTLHADGTISTEKQMDIEASMVLLRKNVRSLGLGIAPLQEVFGELGKLSFPLSISGAIEDPNVTVKGSRLVSESTPGTIIKGTVSGLKGLGGILTGNKNAPEAATAPVEAQ